MARMNEFEAQYGPYKAVGCEWVISTDEAPIIFCGHGTIDPAMPYCAPHHKLAYRKAEKKPKT